MQHTLAFDCLSDPGPKPRLILHLLQPYNWRFRLLWLCSMLCMPDCFQLPRFAAVLLLQLHRERISPWLCRLASSIKQAAAMWAESHQNGQSSSSGAACAALNLDDLYFGLNNTNGSSSWLLFTSKYPNISRSGSLPRKACS